MEDLGRRARVWVREHRYLLNLPMRVGELKGARRSLRDAALEEFAVFERASRREMFSFSFWLVSVLVVAVLGSAVLSGCGVGGDAVVSPTATARSVATSVPTAAASPTPTAEEGASMVECEDCQYGDEPLVSRVEWVSGPQVDILGAFRMTVRLPEDVAVVFPDCVNGASANVALGDVVSGGLYGAVVPPVSPACEWGDQGPGWWVADVWRWDGIELEVEAQVDEALARTEGVEVCFWDGQRPGGSVLGCRGLIAP